MKKFKVIETSRFLDNEAMGEIKGGAPLNPDDDRIKIKYCAGLIDYGVIHPCLSMTYDSCSLKHHIGTCNPNYWF